MSDARALTYVELDLNVCSLSFGVAPCTATLEGEEPTGTIKCFNSVATCQDRANFAASTVTLRFAIGTDYLPEDIEAIPIVESIDFSPGSIALGRDLGQRTSVTVNLRDIRWSDTGPGFDKYHAERDYNPFEQGSFGGKFRARQPYLRGRSIRVIRGRVGQLLAEMETRHYVVESSTGPGLDGRWQIVAKDVLKLLDGDRAQAPAVSTGRLESAIDADDTAAAITPTDVGGEYAASGYLNLGGKEIISYTRSGDDLTITRSQLGTPPDSHAAGDRVQQVLRYSGEDPADIIYDLMVTYGGVDPSFIDLASWQAETAAFNRRLYTATIADPTPVRALVSELIQQAALAIWWDDEAQKIRLQVLRAISTDAELFDDDIVEPGSLAPPQEQPDRRVSQVWTYFAQANPLEAQDDPKNYRSLAVTIDLDAEEDYGAPKIEKVFSRWIPDGARSVATRLNDLLIARFRNAPRRFRFSVFRDSTATPQLGEGCLLDAWPLQGATGAREQVPIQITRLNSDSVRHGIEAEEMRFFEENPEDPNARPIFLDGSLNNANLRTLHDQFYPAPVGGETVTCIVEPGVIIGSASTALPAFDVTEDWPTDVRLGNQTSGSPVITGIVTTDLAEGMPVTGIGIPAGTTIDSISGVNEITLSAAATSGAGAMSLTFHLVIIILEVRGRLQGAGGSGGRGKTYGGAAATNGSPGGPALKVRRPITLIDANGDIYGGGGGGGGAGVLNLGEHKGGGGGGGAGRVPGGGGASDYAAGGPGSLDAGGPGGTSYASNWWFESPFETTPGGTGGAPGLAGQDGPFFGGNPAESGAGGGGSPGASIDGISHVTTSGSAGDRRGPQIN